MHIYYFSLIVFLRERHFLDIKLPFFLLVAVYNVKVNIYDFALTFRAIDKDRWKESQIVINLENVPYTYRQVLEERAGARNLNVHLVQRNRDKRFRSVCTVDVREKEPFFF